MGENIFLFVPNLIDYARVVLAIISFYYMPFDHVKACVFYFLSYILDEVDGWAARKFNQVTRFGGLLDMVIDRCATTCLIMALCYLYPGWLLVWQLLVALDISSHWIHVYSSVASGELSHKVTDLSANPLVRLYYIPVVLSITCAANELFFASVYLNHFTPGYEFHILGHVIGFWYVLAIVTFPISFMKQVVHIILLVAASRNIGALDVISRERKKKANN